MLPIVVLAAVFVLIAVRQVGSLKLQIWHAMLLGAAVVLLTGRISPAAALRAVDLDVMLFLFGMFVIGRALEESGYLAHLSHRWLKTARSADRLVLMILFGVGIASAFLMNDTLAIVGTPLMLQLSKKHRISGKLLLLTLAFAVTIGSVMSPIGNPQNLLIAVHGRIADPFVTFFRYLALPSLLNLGIAFFVLKFYFHPHFQNHSLNHSPEEILDPALARLSRLALVLVVGLVSAKIGVALAGWEVEFRLTYIALISAAPILLFSPRRAGLLRRIDWPTLVFFAAMFVLMESVWAAGFFQGGIGRLKVNLASTPMILLVSVGLSQFISNVPLVALYLPMLTAAGASVKEMVCLAAGSTIAGNLLILGAASNVIIIQNAEARSEETITFLEFAKVGAPLTLLNLAVYWLFLIIPW